MRNQFRLGPFNWTQGASLFKFFSLTERLWLRTNLDVFNVLNVQGLNTPASDGVVTLQDSYGGFGLRPRQVQITMRLEWWEAGYREKVFRTEIELTCSCNQRILS